VDDNISVIHQNPVAGIGAFDSEGLYVFLPQLVFDFFCDCLYLPRIFRSTYYETICNCSQTL
jgi:hypothetical protein